MRLVLFCHADGRSWSLNKTLRRQLNRCLMGTRQSTAILFPYIRMVICCPGIRSLPSTDNGFSATGGSDLDEIGGLFRLNSLSSENMHRVFSCIHYTLAWADIARFSFECAICSRQVTSHASFILLSRQYGVLSTELS